MGKIECHVMEDLLPLYAEELCSPETIQDVEGHLEECVTCREKLEQIKQGDEGVDSGIPVGIQDIRPFRKISRKMKHNRIVKITALILLLIVCSVFGVLTVGQFFPTLDCPNYDSILYRFQAKEIARKLVTGDRNEIREVLAELGAVHDYDRILIFDDWWPLTNDIVEHLAERQTAFGQGDVSICVEGVSYAEGEQERSVYGVQLDIQFEDKEIYMGISFYSRNRYFISMWTDPENDSTLVVNEGTNEDSLEYQVTDINQYLYYYRHWCFGARYENLLMNSCISTQNAKTLEDHKGPGLLWNAAYYLTEDCMKPGVIKEGTGGCTEYSQRTGQQIYQILKKCQSNQFQMTDQDYNETEKKFNATLYWEITDLDGNKCTMIKSFYYGPFGYEPVDDAETIYADVGFGKDLIKKMEVLFD